MTTYLTARRHSASIHLTPVATKIWQAIDSYRWKHARLPTPSFTTHACRHHAAGAGGQIQLEAVGLGAHIEDKLRFLAAKHLSGATDTANPNIDAAKICADGALADLQRVGNFAGGCQPNTGVLAVQMPASPSKTPSHAYDTRILTTQHTCKLQTRERSKLEDTNLHSAGSHSLRRLARQWALLQRPCQFD